MSRYPQIYYRQLSNSFHAFVAAAVLPDTAVQVQYQHTSLVRVVVTQWSLCQTSLSDAGIPRLVPYMIILAILEPSRWCCTDVLVCDFLVVSFVYMCTCSFEQRSHFRKQGMKQGNIEGDFQSPSQAEADVRATFADLTLGIGHVKRLTHQPPTHQGLCA
jgi:hypothetical protein